MRCILNATQEYFKFVGLRPKHIDALLFDYYLMATRSDVGLFGPVAVMWIAQLSIERGDFRPYIYYLKDPFHDLEDMCALANEWEKPFVQPELFDFPFLPWGYPCVACDLTSRHAYFTPSLTPDSKKLIIMAIQIVRL